MEPQQRAELLNRIARLEIMGNHEEAMGMLRPLMDTPKPGPYVVEAYAVLSKYYGEQQQALRLLENLLGEYRLHPSLLARLHYRAGDLYDGMGEYDLAFPHYRSANDALPAQFNGDMYEDFIQTQQRFFTKSAMAGYGRASRYDETPVFIVGMPRSGTTLTESILDRHSMVHGAGELTTVNDIVVSLNRQERWPTGAAYPDCLAALNSEQLDELAVEYLGAARKNAPHALRIVDKMPSNCGHLGLIDMILPGSRVIHCRRDPLDTCLSCYFQNFGNAHQYSRNLDMLAVMYRIYLRMTAMWDGVIDLPVYELHYEKLVAGQENVSRELIDFCGIDWEQGCLSFDESDRVVKTCSYNQVRMPMYSTSVGRWKNYEKHIGPLLAGLEDLVVEYYSG